MSSDDSDPVSTPISIFYHLPVDGQIHMKIQPSPFILRTLHRHLTSLMLHTADTLRHLPVLDHHPTPFNLQCARLPLHCKPLAASVRYGGYDHC